MTVEVAAEQDALERVVLGVGIDGDQESALPCRTERVAADDDPWFAPEPVATACTQRRAYEEQARRLCETCPVRQACLELALRYASRGLGAWGVWGGTAPWTRRTILRRRRSASAASQATAGEAVA